jgi:hypothetical protein
VPRRRGPETKTPGGSSVQEDPPGVEPHVPRRTRAVRGGPGRGDAMDP